MLGGGNVKLTAFEYGKTALSEKMAFPDGDPNVMLPIALLFFLVETEDRKILLDVGCDDLPGFTLFAIRKPIELLEEYGIRREEITDVLLTHAHHDHIDALRYYPQANVYLQKDELPKAKKHLACGNKVYTFDDSIAVTDRITMQHIGGHTVGSGIVLLKSQQDTYVICGDECYTMQNLLLDIPTGSSYCPEKSIAFTKEYRKSCYKPILFHDPEIVGAIGWKTVFAD